MPERLATIRTESTFPEPVRVIKIDHHSFVGSDMGANARPLIEEALRTLDIEQRVNVEIERIEAAGFSSHRANGSTPEL